MKYLHLSIQELHKLLVNKEVTCEALVKEFISKAKKDKESNFLITLSENESLEKARLIDQNLDVTNLLAGIPYLAKDNFSTKNIKTTAGSLILDNYIPPFNATLINLLEKNQTLMIGKSSLDELAMGGTGMSCAFGDMSNPYDSKRQVGGSSSGSAYAVAKGYVPFATGTDTGDSIRKPASYNGIVGFKPTYGAMSRYGIIPYAPSLDHPGFFTRNVDDVAIICDATIKKDELDFTSRDIESKDFFKNLNKLPKETSFGYLEYIHELLSSDLKQVYESLYEKLREQGYTVKPVDFKIELLEVISEVYMMISFSEAVSTHSNLTGINFGSRENGDNYIDIMTNTRTKRLGKVVKRRFLIGSLNLKKDNQEKYMRQAQRVRRLIVNQLEKIYHEVNVLLLPASTDIAPLKSSAFEYETKKQKNKSSFLDELLVLGNLNGMPSVTIPLTFKDGLPIGININTKPTNDLLVLQAAKLLENIINIKNQIAGE